MAAAQHVHRLAGALPRTEVAVVRDRVKFRVGRLVYAALSRDETLLGVAFPKDERSTLIAAEPDRFLPPERSDERYNWVRVRLSAVDVHRLDDLLVDAWLMCVPKRVGAEYLAAR